MRLDAMIWIMMLLIVAIGEAGCLLSDRRVRREQRAKFAQEKAELHRRHQMELARVAAKYCQAVNCAEDRAAEAKAAADKEIQRLKLDNKALREVLRTMEEKQRRAAS